MAANVSLEVLAATKREIEAQAKRNALVAIQNAARAERNSAWAEAEGMRAEEALSRRLLADTSAAETVRRLCTNSQAYLSLTSPSKVEINECPEVV